MILLLACSPITSNPNNGGSSRPSDSAVEHHNTVDSLPDSDPQDSDPQDSDPQDSDPQDSDPPEVDYGARGEHTVTTTTLSVETSCAMSVTLYEPSGGGDRLVVLAHGFARSAANMAGWADHAASHGVIVATPELCHASMWDTDHVENGHDLVELASALGATEVVYAGHSAGGLAALLAADEDDSAVAWVGLDPVDSDGLGAAISLSIPASALIGEPSDCNDSANGAGLDADIELIAGADHCDFESPTDWMCTTFCADAGGDVHDTILELSTAAMVD